MSRPALVFFLLFFLLFVWVLLLLLYILFFAFFAVSAFFSVYDVLTSPLNIDVTSLITILMYFPGMMILTHQTNGMFT
uniref:Triacylglycerol lipase n=1 Tax=Solanum tuberosum TaxID=4113 RepID=M0ZMJ6_SOLTU